MSQTKPKDEPELSAVIIHVEPELLTMQDELDFPTLRNEQNELYKSRGLKREVRLNHREGGGMIGF